MKRAWAHGRVATVAMVIALTFSLPAYPQEFRSVGLGFAGLPNQSMDFNAFMRGAWFSSLRVGKASVGIFVGGGTIKVDHTIEAGPNHVAAITGFHDFDDFSHVRETRLSDTFVALDGGLASQGFEFLKVRFETNLGRVTQFRQWTEPGVQHPFGWHSRYAVGSVLGLPNNLEGIIHLDNRNRIWTWDVIGRIPGSWGLDVLLEYKWSSIRSSIDPYVGDNPILAAGFLSPNVGWRNNWTNAIPSTTSFNMAQLFKWHGPFIGLGCRYPFSPLGGGAYLDCVASPWVFGKYEFGWGAAYEDSFFFVRGWQGTQISGWDRIGLEFRGGITCSLLRSLALAVGGKYTYVRLRGHDTEYQSMSNNFLATRDYVQGAQEYVTLTQRFWQIGGEVNWTF